MDTWQAHLARALQGPVSKNMYWLHDLQRFAGWQSFVQMLKKEHGAICFTNKTAPGVHDAYDGQHVVVFNLAGCTADDNIDHVMSYIRKLKRGGPLWGTVRGVQTFNPPHVLVFADFPAPRPRSKAEKIAKPSSNAEPNVHKSAERETASNGKRKAEAAGLVE
jgi:hypothetical protein